MPSELEVKFFSLASDSAKMLLTLLRAKKQVHQYYDSVEAMTVLDQMPNELAVGLVQELSTLPEASVKESNLINIIALSLNLLTKLTQQNYLLDFQRLIQMSRVNDRDENHKE